MAYASTLGASAARAMATASRPTSTDRSLRSLSISVPARLATTRADAAVGGWSRHDAAACSSAAIDMVRSPVIHSARA